MCKALLCSIVVAVVLVAGPAMAAQIIQTEAFSGTPDLTRTLTFDEFDDLGGTLTLTSIQVSVSLSAIGGQLILDNDGESSASGSFDFGAKGDISSTDVSLLDAGLFPVTSEVQAGHNQAFSLDPNTGDGPSDFDPTAPDGLQYNGGTETDSDSGLISGTVFNQYIGTGTYDIDVDVTQWQDFGGLSGIEWAVTPVSASGNVTVIYNYIPEPATLGLLSLGALALLRRRRA